MSSWRIFCAAAEKRRAAVPTTDASAPRAQFVKVCDALHLIANQLSRMALHHAQQARNIIERKKNEALLRENEQCLELALAGADLGTWDWNVQTGELIVDARYAAMFGRAPEELQGLMTMAKRWAHPEDTLRLKHQINKNFTGVVPFYECEFRM